MANSYPASGTVILDDLKVCTSGRLQPSFTSTGEHMFLTLESAHLNSYLPVVTFVRAGCTLGAIGLERASNSDSLGNYTESEMVIGTRANTPTSIQSGGVRRIVVSSGGNIGIGLPSPCGALDVYKGGSGATGVGDNLILRGGNNNNLFGSNQIRFGYSGGTGYSHAIKTRHNSGTSAQNALDFFLWTTSDAVETVGTRNVMTLEGTGNVGIGTCSPSSKLDVSGADGKIQSRVDSSDGSTINVRPNAGKCGWISYTEDAVADRWGIGVKNGDAKLYFASGNVASGGGTTRMVIDGTGNVGISTTSPNTPLQIRSNTIDSGGSGLSVFGFDGAAEFTTTRAESPANAAIYLYNRPTSGTNGTGTGISFRASSTNTADRPQGGFYSSWTDSTDATRTSKFFFDLVNSGTYATRMTLLGSGALGLGTTSPASRLHINHTGAEGACTIILQSTNSCGNGTISWRSSGGVTQAQIGANYNVSDPAGNLELITSGATRLLVTSAGCVGIGTTSPSYRFHVNGTFYAAGSSIDYKEGICQYNTDSCLFMCLKPVTYQYKDEFKHLGKELKSETQIGLIAEDVAESYPELAILVNEEDNKVVRNVDYEKLSIILLSELQKLRKEVDELKQ